MHALKDFNISLIKYHHKMFLHMKTKVLIKKTGKKVRNDCTRSIKSEIQFS